MRRHSEDCEPHCISGDQFKAAMEIMGIWFDGNILDVRLENRPQTGLRVHPGHRSPWHAVVTVATPGAPGPYETRTVYVPIHTGEPESRRASDLTQTSLSVLK